MFVLRPITPPSQPMPAVSVIVPMYNVEKYIAETLDSILNQTFQDFEVIVVNDCSPDNSRAIAESYVPKFGGRMTLLDNEKNSGPGASRNNGLRHATGEYVFFMDADDLLLPNSLEEMHWFAKQSDADVVSFKLRCNVSEDGKTVLGIIEHKQPRLDPDTVLIDDTNNLTVASIEDLTIIKKSFPYKSTLTWRIKKALSLGRLPHDIWLKFLKRSFLLENELFFLEDIYNGEDQIWAYGIYLCAQKMLHVPRVLYHHRLSEGSIVRTPRTPLHNMRLWVTTFTSGIKWVDSIMNRLDFFKEHPEYRYEILEPFCRRYTVKIFSKVRKIRPYDIYESIKQDFGDAWGENATLIASLITYTDIQRKRIVELEDQLKTINN